MFCFFYKYVHIYTSGLSKVIFLFMEDKSVTVNNKLLVKQKHIYRTETPQISKDTNNKSLIIRKHLNHSSRWW